MAIGPRLDLRQTQSLVMTPQLQQAIRLLQMSAPELLEYVDEELESNPLLDRDESGGDGALSEAMGNEDDRSEDGMNVVDSVENQTDAPMDIDEGFTENDAAFDTAADSAGGLTGGDAPIQSGGSSFDDMLPSLEQTLSEAVDLRSHLEQQLNLSIEEQSDRLVGSALIDSLDENGYLTTGVTDLADQLGTSLEAVEDVLAVLQTFDPPGLFARDLKECLALQLRDRNRYDPAMEALIENLDLLAKRDFAELKNICQIDEEDLAEMINEIRALDPKPALKFETSVSQTVIPDVIMTPTSDGGWRVELNSETLPRVLINNQYYAELTKTAGEKEKTFVAERFQSATWLVRALEQRATTILKVATALIGKQDDFFRKGVTHLRPLVLRDIAELTELHESTISRVTVNKFMATPRGIYELKYFFSHGLMRSDGGQDTSAEAVRHSIKHLVENETIDAILSDDQIVDALRTSGIVVARRTVAKYRESLKIPSSVQRRRERTHSPSAT